MFGNERIDLAVRDHFFQHFVDRVQQLGVARRHADRVLFFRCRLRIIIERGALQIVVSRILRKVLRGELVDDHAVKRVRTKHRLDRHLCVVIRLALGAAVFEHAVKIDAVTRAYLSGENRDIPDEFKTKANLLLADLTDKMLSADDFAMVVTKQNAKLQGELNAALKALKENGEYDKIWKKWFGEAK